MIKKLLKGIAIIFLVLVILIVSVGAWTGYKSAGYELTAIPFMAEAIPEISKWDSAIMRSYMDPETLEGVSEEDFSEMVRVLSKMGSLISTEEPVFQTVNSSSTIQHGAMTLVTYHVPATYENGEAKLTVVLKEKETSFDVYRFKVESMALFK